MLIGVSKTSQTTRRKETILKRKLTTSSKSPLTVEVIWTIVHQAVDDVYDYLSQADINIALEKLRKIKVWNEFLRWELRFVKNLKKVFYDDTEKYLSDDEYDYEHDTDLSASIEDEILCSISASGKSQFHEVRVYTIVLHFLLRNLSVDRIKRVQETSR